MGVKVKEFITQLDLNGTKLAHWGVKGMRWGIRRSDEELAGSADAVRAAATLKAIQKAGSLSVVSDADLSHLTNRIGAEQRYAAINKSVAAQGHSQIKSLLGVGETMNKAITFANSPAGKLLAASLGLAKSTGKHAKR